jgi:hypothetical protein
MDGHDIRSVRRRVGVVALSLALVWSVSGAPPAKADSDWDPDDVSGRFDLRWIGAIYRDEDTVSLTVSFYPGFRIADLPGGRDPISPGVWFDIDAFMTGWFSRSDGTVRFRYGDTASACCQVRHVRVVTPTVLRVVFPVVDEGDPGISIRGHSRWGRARGPHDWTGRLRLPPPR